MMSGPSVELSSIATGEFPAGVSSNGQEAATMGDDVMDERQLMGLEDGEEIPAAPEASKSSKKAPVVKGKGVEENPLLWGLPGHLTKEETDTYFKFKTEVETRGGDFRDTVYCFGEEEGEVWALSRWLRARKYVYDDVIKMVEEATEVRADAKKHGFYPNPVDALGVDASLYFAQFPQLYTGQAKNGVPLFISKPGIINVDGIEQITSIDGIIKFHWHIMMHDFADRLRAAKKKDPNFKRFECLCVLDLDNLTTSQLSSRCLAIIKEQAAIDGVCFPETMNKMLLINSPTFFSATWRLIKGWLDPRTAAKIEVISSRSHGEKRLLELVDAEHLPSDYGGTYKDTDAIIRESTHGDADKMDTKMMYIRGSGAETLEVGEGESVDITCWTRSTAGAKFTVTEAGSKKDVAGPVEIKAESGDDGAKATTGKITTERISGPASLKIKAASNAGRFSRQDFLLVFSHFKK